MDFDEYQKLSRKTMVAAPKFMPDPVYLALGLGETGELQNKIKKIYRDKDGHISEEDRQALEYELGDVLWYLTQLCTEFNLTLEEVAQANIEKLYARWERGTIRGEGDER